MWSSLVDFFELAIFIAGQSFGGNLGLGIFLVTAATRLLMLPITYRLARQARLRRAALASIQEDLSALKQKWASDPGRRLEEIRALHASRGIDLVDTSSIKLAVIQSPLAIALFQAVRRVVSGSQLAATSLPVAFLAASVASTAVASGNQTASGVALVSYAIVAGLMAGMLTIMMGSGFGLYSAAFQSISTIQGFLLRRADRRTHQAVAG